MRTGARCSCQRHLPSCRRKAPEQPACGAAKEEGDHEISSMGEGGREGGKEGRAEGGQRELQWDSKKAYSPVIWLKFRGASLSAGTVLSYSTHSDIMDNSQCRSSILHTQVSTSQLCP
eukprot:1154237-Pelagomonas_calceolata.AAC.7